MWGGFPKMVREILIALEISVQARNYSQTDK